ncbi:TPA: hypothetical protein MFN52_004838, partial [Klebsiella quasipneumoniae subsp. similipneumoniae]|nr:hypothetical protein [Klebsiella quasipneumoniae subsp. similipneumoniae]
MRNAREFLSFSLGRWFFFYIAADPRRFRSWFDALLWIILCVNGYKAGFCWGMQQSVIFLPFFYCGRSR